MISVAIICIGIIPQNRAKKLILYQEEWISILLYYLHFVFQLTSIKSEKCKECEEYEEKNFAEFVQNFVKVIQRDCKY